MSRNVGRPRGAEAGLCSVCHLLFSVDFLVLVIRREVECAGKERCRKCRSVWKSLEMLSAFLSAQEGRQSVDASQEGDR